MNLAGLTVDNASIRIDEHDRACLWCAKNFPEQCERRKALQAALEQQVSASPANGKANGEK